MRRNHGFTLIELIIVIVLTSIVSGFVAVLLNAGYESYLNASPIAILAGKGNVALNSMLREINSAERINAMSSTVMNYTNQQGQTIVVDLSGTTLRKSVNGGAARSLCTNVTAFAFRYYDAGLATTANPASVNFLTVSLTLSEETIPYSLMAGTLLRKRL